MNQINKRDRILIILTGSLGDVVRGMSLLPAIKDDPRNFEVAWLVDSRWEGLLKNHPKVDHLFVWPRPYRCQSTLKIIHEIRNFQADYVLDLQRILKSGFFSYFSGAKNRLGFHPDNSKEFNHLFNNIYIDYRPNDFPKINQYHDFLKKLGISSSEPYSFCLEHLSNNAAKFGIIKKSIAIVLESSWDSKDWFSDYYVGLVNLILQKTNLQIVLLGMKKSQPIGALIENVHPSQRILNLINRTSLPELAGVLGTVQLAVGPDSGPGHLAAAMGKPYFSIFGPTAPDRVAPYQARELAIEVEFSCRPCNHKICPRGDKACLRLITPEIIFARINQWSLEFKQGRSL